MSGPETVIDDMAAALRELRARFPYWVIVYGEYTRRFEAYAGLADTSISVSGKTPAMLMDAILDAQKYTPAYEPPSWSWLGIDPETMRERVEVRMKGEVGQ